MNRMHYFPELSCDHQLLEIHTEEKRKEKKKKENVSKYINK